jgi:hypothetical protein
MLKGTFNKMDVIGKARVGSEGVNFSGAEGIRD